jgi:hypothetical protein
MAELLEYQGLYSDNVGSLYWYRVSAAQHTASKFFSDRLPEPAWPSDVVDIPRQRELAPIPGSTQLMAKFQTWLQHPRLRYALLVLVMGAALVALWSRTVFNTTTFSSLSPALLAARIARLVTCRLVCDEGRPLGCGGCSSADGTPNTVVGNLDRNQVFRRDVLDRIALDVF